MRVGYLLLVLISGSLQGCFPVVAVGVGVGTMLVQDRRSRDALIDDQKIETRASLLLDQQFKNVMHVNVTSYNHNALISGEVPDEPTKFEIGKIVSDIKSVRDVYNELAVSSISSITSRSNDALITSNIKLRYMDDKRFGADHVKVVSENGTVYLMGIVNHAEVDAASEVASTTKGVQRVVKMFEYLD